MLHVSALHEGLHSPPVQGERNAVINPVHDPQRALHGEFGGSDSRFDRGRHVLGVQEGDAGAVLWLTDVNERPPCGPNTKLVDHLTMPPTADGSPLRKSRTNKTQVDEV